jgi:hypothetical protein
VRLVSHSAALERPLAAAAIRLLWRYPIDRFFGQGDWGGLPRAAVEDSIRRFATETAPAVRLQASAVAA